MSKLEAAYRATCYRVYLPTGICDLYVDQPNPTIAAWLKAEDARCWALLTAFNPGSQPSSEAENAERQSALEVELLELGYEPYFAENIAPSDDWPIETSCLILGISREIALAMGEKFAQNAILYGENDGTPRLAWINKDHV